MNDRDAAADPQLDLDDIQGLVFDAYDHLPHAYYVVYRIMNPRSAREWVSRVAHLVRSSRPPLPGTEAVEDAIHLAFTVDGLEELGFDDNLLTGFSNEFQMGMNDAYRSRVLGDVDMDSPPYWYFGAVQRPGTLAAAKNEAAVGRPPTPLVSPDEPSVHVLLMIFAASKDRLDTRLGEVEGLCPMEALAIERVVDPIYGVRYPDGKEHFGFRDGIAQPAIAGAGAPPTDGQRPTAAGEFVLGYRNEYGQFPPTPLVPRGQDPGGLLPKSVDERTMHDFGRNGTYLVLRQLRQFVRAFWAAARANSLRLGPGGAEDETGVRFAAKMVGRWPSGAPLSLSPDRDDPSLAMANQFGYRPSGGEADRYGCPFGAHIRRANPRDTLLDEADDPTGQKSLEEVRKHQIIRRSRVYGAPRLDPKDLVVDGLEGIFGSEGFSIPKVLKPPRPADDRGLIFIALNANIARQFEFIQQSWLNNPNVNRLRDEVDPLTGVDPDPAFHAHPAPPSDTGVPPAGGAVSSGDPMVPKAPLLHRDFSVQTRLGPRRFQLNSFVRMKGGAYFFLPGLRALTWLGTHGYASE